MSQASNQVACAAFQSNLPQLIASGEDFADHPHFKDCDVCRALLADLETIAATARQMFPIVEPPDALWEQIESAIEHEESALGRHSNAS
jgi:TATA-binding protein-associated factor Taf7